MALNFLDLTNDVLKRLNEVPLSSTTFDTNSNIHKDAQLCVNASLNRIHREHFEWPFQHKKTTLVLTPGQNTYPYPVTAKSVALDSFRLKKDLSLSMNAKKLLVKDLEEFLEEYPDFEDETSDQWGWPEFIIRNRDLSFTIYPTPKEAFTLVYEWYELPVDLVDWDSQTTLPDFFRWVITEGAMYYAYTFRGALEEASASNTLFEEGMKDLRTLFINRYEYVRATTIRR